MIQKTSLLAYLDVIPELGERQAEVFRIINVFQPISNKEIATVMNMPINSITPRVFELREKGLVKKHDTITYKYGKKNVRAIRWVVK
jgi:DNA-binding MarR family transcriptional regulator